MLSTTSTKKEADDKLMNNQPDEIYKIKGVEGNMNKQHQAKQLITFGKFHQPPSYWYMFYIVNHPWNLYVN